MTEGLFVLNFGQAIEALKQGKRVARKNWNGKGMFIFMRPADELNTAYLCMKAADGTIVNGWLASQTDMLSEDWAILE